MTVTITEAVLPHDQPAANLRCVFVYGTLRRRQERDINLLRPRPIFVGTSQTLGTLYDLGACNYPGLRLGGLQYVQGEVYRITPELEHQLDEIEHVAPVPTGEYIRREVTVRVPGDGGLAAGDVVAIHCLIYEIAKERVAGMRVIASGDWLQRG